MKTILVDDELWAMRQFEVECANLAGIELCGMFDSSREALEYAKENLVEFALLDIEMPGMNGMELALELRKIYPKIIIVFVTSHSNHLIDFIHMKADYYVLKPYSKQDVEDVIARAVLLSRRLPKRIQIQTFGKFEVFVDGIPISINGAKPRELLALLVDKQGGELDAKEAFSKMWENKEYNNKNANVYRQTLSRLQNNLKELGLEELILTLPHGRAINTELFDCDLYDLLEQRTEAIEQFNGEYLTEYSWGEATLGRLYSRFGECGWMKRIISS